MNSPKNKMVIGWREWVTFPGLLEESVKAKIDSGARTSAIHAANIQTFTERGAPHVSFTLYPLQRRQSPAVRCISEIRDEREIKSSTGHRHPRYVIEIDVCLGGMTWPIEVTLADRALMGFRLLLGRQAIKGGFLIDPHRSFITSRNFAAVSTKSTNER